MCSRRIIEKNNFSVKMTTILEIVCVNALTSVMSQLLNINYLKETIMHILLNYIKNQQKMTCAFDM